VVPAEAKLARVVAVLEDDDFDVMDGYLFLIESLYCVHCVVLCCVVYPCLDCLCVRLSVFLSVCLYVSCFLHSVTVTTQRIQYMQDDSLKALSHDTGCEKNPDEDKG